MLRVDVYDNDAKDSTDLAKHEMQGVAQFSLAELMASQSQALTRNLARASSAAKGKSIGAVVPPAGGKEGRVTVHAEELAACSEFLELGLVGKRLANKDG